MKYPMSEKGKEMLQFQADLATKHGYKPIMKPNPEYSENTLQPISIQKKIHDDSFVKKYKAELPEWCKRSDCAKEPLISLDGTLLCTKFERIVIGDYGAFIEIAPEHMVLNNLKVKEGQEFRINDEKYSLHVKYHWYTAKDNSDCKVYFQQKTVTYADYKPGMYYISPYEVIPALLELEQAKNNKFIGKITDLLPCPIGTIVHEPYKFLGDGAWEIDHHRLKLEDLEKIEKGLVFIEESDAEAYIAEQERLENSQLPESIKELEDFLQKKVNWTYFLNSAGLAGSHCTVDKASFVSLEQNEVNLKVELTESDDRHEEYYTENRTYSLEKLQEVFRWNQQINRFDSKWFSCRNGIAHFNDLVEKVLNIIDQGQSQQIPLIKR